MLDPPAGTAIDSSAERSPTFVPVLDLSLLILLSLFLLFSSFFLACLASLFLVGNLLELLNTELNTVPLSVLLSVMKDNIERIDQLTENLELSEDNREIEELSETSRF